MKLTETDLSFLSLIERYGDGFDVTSARIGKALKASATALLKSGHLEGKRKSLRITPEGRAALEQGE